MNRYTKEQKRILKMIKQNPGRVIITAEQGLGKIKKIY